MTVIIQVVSFPNDVNNHVRNDDFSIKMTINIFLSLTKSIRQNVNKSLLTPLVPGDKIISTSKGKAELFLFNLLVPTILLVPDKMSGTSKHSTVWQKNVP